MFRETPSVTASPQDARERRQVTWFLPEPVASIVDQVRADVDPVMHALIRPHVTVVHEAEDVDPLELEGLVAGVEAFPVHLGRARRWEPVSHALYLDVTGGSGGLAAVRRALGADPAGEFTPHVTLAHPWTVTPDDASQAWPGLSGWAVDREAIVDRLHLIEGGAAGWRSIAEAALA